MRERRSGVGGVPWELVGCRREGEGIWPLPLPEPRRGPDPVAAAATVLA